jgi:hypothetical protein
MTRIPISIGTLLCVGLWALLPVGVPQSAAQELFEGTTDFIPADIDAMYKKGIDYLIKTQKPDGTWGGQGNDYYGNQPGVVGLCVVAILAHGEDPNRGPYSQVIKRGLDFVISQQNKSTGYIGNSMYNHGFATLALAEAYGMVNDARLGPALESATKLILNSQERNAFGAWRYSPESRDADSTVSGANLVALFAARNAGIRVPEEAMQKALKFFALCQGGDGGIGYTSAGGSNGPRTAIGVLCWALAKQKDSPRFKASFEFLNSKGAGSARSEGYFHYYLYYAAQAYFHASPQAWQEWNAANIAMLKEGQAADGSWNGNYGNTFATGASLLSLALNYRFLPIYER